MDLIVPNANVDLASIGQGPNDIHELARRNSGFSRRFWLQSHSGNHFHFEISGGKRNSIVVGHYKQIRQHRQGLPSFNNTHDLLQWFKQSFTLCAELHDLPLLFLFLENLIDDDEEAVLDLFKTCFFRLKSYG